jgi:hypothetical protein
MRSVDQRHEQGGLDDEAETDEGRPRRSSHLRAVRPCGEHGRDEISRGDTVASGPSNTSRPYVQRPEVILNYIDKLHESFTAARGYTNRLLIGIVAVSLLMIALAGGAVSGSSFELAGGSFTFDIWALLLAGALYLAVTPGFVVGRMRYIGSLAREMDLLYRDLDEGFTALKSPGVYPFEVPALIAEATIAGDRFGASPNDTHVGAAERKWWTRALDFLGGPLTVVLVLGVLPLTGQGFAVSWWLSDEATPGSKAVKVLLIVTLMGFTVLSVVGAARRWWVTEAKPRRDRAAAETVARKSA